MLCFVSCVDPCTLYSHVFNSIIIIVLVLMTNFDNLNIELIIDCTTGCAEFKFKNRNLKLKIREKLIFVVGVVSIVHKWGGIVTSGPYLAGNTPDTHSSNLHDGLI
jgi:hypothetical protein